ncbi:MAG: PepSY-associated TM helix domain-containing protein, partial [Cyclobacteriaceae bacterium]
MKLDKKKFFRIHSWIGIKLSVLFFIVCLSGTLATVSHEMDWLFNPEIRVSPQGELVSRNLLVANVQAAFPESEILYWSVPNEPYLCNIVQVYQGKQGHYVFVNPYTGEVQGSAKLTFQRFFRDLHYYLFVPFQIGHFTVLIFGFLLLFSLVTALVFYKKWYR